MSSKLRNVPHDITVDRVHHEIHAAQVFEANFGGLTRRLQPRPQIRPDDGMLEVIALSASGRRTGLLAAWEALGRARFGDRPGGRVFRARACEVQIGTKRPVLVEADGDVIGTTPLSFTINPGALAVLAPKQ